MNDRIEAHVWRLCAVVILGSMMSILDTTIVNVALDTLGRDLHATVSQIQWVSTGYLLSLAAVIPVSGWAARKFGAKQVYLVSLVLFTAGSALCGLATSTTELVVFRVLQGVGGGMIMPVVQLMMAEAAGPKRMGRVMSVVAVPMMLAPILGPTIGGLILDNASWRWIFYVNVPVGVIAFCLAWRMLPRVEPQRVDPLDWRGLVLLASGLPLVTYGLAEIGSTGSFTSGRVLIPAIVGVVLIAAFVRYALRARFPLLNIRLYRRPTFSSASAAMFCLAAALFGGMILLPLYWQQIRHQSVVDTGLLTAPQGLGAAVAMPFAGRLTDRYGGGPLALIGVLLVGLGTIPFGLITDHTSIVWLSVVMVVRGVGIGFGFMPAMTAAFAALDRSELAHATPQLNTLQRVGGSIGTAILAVVLQRASVGVHSSSGAAGAFGTAFWASAALTFAGVVPAIILTVTERRARRAAAASAAELETEGHPSELGAEAVVA